MMTSSTLRSIGKAKTRWLRTERHQHETIGCVKPIQLPQNPYLCVSSSCQAVQHHRLGSVGLTERGYVRIAIATIVVVRQVIRIAAVTVIVIIVKLLKECATLFCAMQAEIEPRDRGGDHCAWKSEMQKRMSKLCSIRR